MFRPLISTSALLLLVLSACGGGSPSPSISDVYTSLDKGPGSGADRASVPEAGGCEPDCAGKECGSDDCGGSCGECPGGEHSNPEFICRPGECTPGQVECQGGGIAVCFADGSGWSGTTPCSAGKVCLGGECVEPEEICTPGQKACAGNAVITCTSDGTAWSPPSGCPAATECVNGACVSTGQKGCKTILACMLTKKCGQPEPECMPECFDNGTEGAVGKAQAVYYCVFQKCGKWGPGEACFQNERIAGCAGAFGSCNQGGCVTSCAGKQCGPDGCGGQCGQCPGETTCTDGLCIGCAPNCANKDCGGDGCGGQCGQCPGGQVCNAQGKCKPGGACGGVTFQGCCDGEKLHWCEGGQLQSQNCQWQPHCGWKQQVGYYECGTAGDPDPAGQFPKACDFGCEPNCAGKQCGSDGCGGSCGGCPNESTCIGGQCEEGLKCMDIVQCVFTCGSDSNCYMDCWESGAPDSQDLFEDLSICVMEFCNMIISQQCLEDAVDGPCADAYEACEAEYSE